MRIIGSSGPAPPPPPSWRRRWQRRWQRSRRLVAAALLAVASGTAVHAVAVGHRAPTTTSVLAAARDLPAGTALTPTVTTRVAMPAGLVPAGALHEAAAAQGRTLTGPVRRGEVITDSRLLGAGLLRDLGPDEMAVPVRVDPPLPQGLVEPGDAVAVLAGGAGDGAVGADAAGADDAALDAADGTTPADAPSGLLVDRAVVLAVPRAASAGLGVSTTATPATVVVLALTASQAARVAASTDAPIILGVLPPA